MADEKTILEGKYKFALTNYGNVFDTLATATAMNEILATENAELKAKLAEKSATTDEGDLD